MNEEKNPILELFDHFDKLQLEVLTVHISIHRRLFRMLGQRLGCSPDDLPNLKFMHAAELAFAGRDHGNIVKLLQKLDGARNAIAHEGNPAKFTAKFATFCREVLGPQYVESPAGFEAKRKQDYTALNFVKVLVDTSKPPN